MRQIKERPYIIENVIAERTINLLGGPVGAGKTSWLVKALLDFQEGKDVLDNTTHPCPFLYISADRAVEDVHESLFRLGMREEPFPIVDVKDNSLQVTDLVNLIPPTTKLVIIEAIAMMMGDARVNDMITVGRWLREVRGFCSRQDLTIIGTCHTAKAKEGDHYSAPKQRFLGSVAWGGYADTLLLLEPRKPSDPECRDRIMWVMPKNRADSRHDFIVSEEDGSLILQPKLEAPRLQLWSRLPPGVQLERKAIVAYAEPLDIKTRTLDRMLEKMVKVGELEKVGQGLYIRPAGTTDVTQMVLKGK